jgi:hypothetical protein
MLHALRAAGPLFCRWCYWHRSADHLARCRTALDRRSAHPDDPPGFPWRGEVTLDEGKMTG